MDKQAELRQAKRLALLFFAAAGATFVVTLFLPPGWWVNLVKAFAEAAMVGALADWFAVAALFRKIPIPYVSRHTEIIPKNQARIADNLAGFVRDKFLDTESVVALIRRHDPARIIADWLLETENTRRFGAALVKLAAGILDFIDDAPVQKMIGKAVHELIGKVDLSKSAGAILETLTRDGRHQQLLDQAIGQLAGLLAHEDTQAFIAQGIVDWLKDELPWIEKALPSELLGRKGADLLVRLAASILERVNADPEHQVRKNFDAFSRDFIERLQRDPAFIEKGEEIKRRLQDDAALGVYLNGLWGDLKRWLKADLASEHSSLHQRVVQAGGWLGGVLAGDVQLRGSLNGHLETAVRGAAPEFADFLTTHIADTVKKWDSREMSAQIELNIGKDLQFIRINGTLVGGLIGVLLYLLAQLPQLLGAARLAG